MPSFIIQETIHQPRSAVWEAMLDIEAWPEFIDGIESTRRLDSPPTKLGSRFEETRRFGSKAERFIVEVTAFEPERLYAGSVFHEGVEFRHTYTLEDAPAAGHGNSTGTQVTMEATVVARSLLARTLCRPLLGIAMKMMKKHDSDLLRQLKAWVETPASTLSPREHAQP